LRIRVAAWLFRLDPLVKTAVAIAILLFTFGMTASEVMEGETLVFDEWLLANLWKSRGLEEAARDVTALGSFSILFLIIGAAAVSFLLLRRKDLAIYIVIAVLGGTALNSILKVLFDRPRPELAGVMMGATPSFPSAHTAVSAVAYLTLAACLAETVTERRLKRFYLCFAMLLTGLVGLSRLYLGVHYPTDVIAGWAIGITWALLCWMVFRSASCPKAN